MGFSFFIFRDLNNVFYEGGVNMKIIDIGNAILSMVPFTKTEKKPNLIKDVIDNPEKFVLIASIEEEKREIRITIKPKRERQKKRES